MDKKQSWASPKVVIDIYYLANQRILLSELEYYNRRLPRPYSEYCELYYQRRIVDIFDDFKDKKWFIERYLTEVKSPQQRHLRGKFVIVVEDLDPDAFAADIIKTFESSAAVKSVFISLKGPREDFKRNAYLLLNDNFDPHAIIKSLSLPYETFVVDLENLSINEICLISSAKAFEIIKSLCSLNKINIETLQEEIDAAKDMNEEDKAMHYIKLLRDKFLFCHICYKQYDNDIDMLISCSKHSESNLNRRNIDILCNPKDFKHLNYMNEMNELQKHMIRTAEGNFKCLECHKDFESYEFASKHIVSKHPVLFTEINEQQTLFGNLIQNIDLFLLDVLEGTFIHPLPFFCKNYISSRIVVYDLPHLFSGEIKLNKN